MNRARVRHIANAVMALAIGVAILFVALVFLDRGSPGPLTYDEEYPITALYVVLVVAFPALGTIIARRYPSNVIGWLLCFSGVGIGVAACGQLYADIALFARPGSLPGGEVAAWVSSWLFPIALLMTPLYLLYLFPTGRPLSPVWRWGVVITSVALLVGFPAAALVPGDIEPWEGVRNPFGLGGMPGTIAESIAGVHEMLAMPGFLVAVAALIARTRRARGVERQQLKWFGFSASIMGGGFALAFLFSALGNQGASDLAFVVGALGLLGIPFASALAILRYRLYDIDVLINRALVYVLLTAVLVGAYAVGVLLFRALLDPITGDNDLAIAASTLAVAALFGPARRRIQAFIDRRFYRSRYDAQQTLEQFAARVRSEVDLDAVAAGLLRTVRDSMHPAHAGVSLLTKERR